MEDEYNDSQDSINDANRNSDGNDSGGDAPKDFGDGFGGYDDSYDDEDSGRNGRNGRGNFRGRGRGPPPGWMNGPPPMRFRGRGYGPGGPPMRGRGFFRGRGGPRFNNGPNFDNNWGPMGPPPPGMMGGPPPFGPPPGMMGPGGHMGPPPNMMGQPPPFGGPPGMPPPNMQPGPELWVETKSEDGKSYYYHARTRETTWTRPQESPTCKVITQPEMEAMAASGQMPSMGAPQQMPMNAGPMGGPMGMMPPGVAPPTSGAGPPFMQPPPWATKPDNASEEGIPSLFSKEAIPPFMQPPPWASKPDDHKDGNQSDNESNDAPPGESVTTLPPQQPPSNGFPGQPGGGPPPGPAGPWSGWPGAPGGVPGGAGWPPPLTGQPPPLLGNTPQQQGNQLPPQIAAMAQQAASSGQIQMNIPTSLPQAQPPMGVPPQMGAGQPPLGNMGGGPPQLGGMGAGPPQLGGMGAGPPQLGNMGIPQPQLGNMGIPQLNVPTSQPLAVQEKEQEQKNEESRIPPELAAAASEWTTHRAPDGRHYYYHSRRHESVWEKPDALKELEDFQAKLASEQAGETPDGKPEKMDVDDRKPDVQVIDVDAHAAVAEAAAREAAERARLERQRAEEAQREKERLEKEKEEKAKMDGSRPMWSTHVAGTPWRVVWTAEGRVFFFNPSVPRSVWARPAELLGREDVDKLISQPPEHLAKLQGTTAATPAAAATTKAADKNGELKRAADSDSDDSEEEPVKKQQKGEEGKKVGAVTNIDAGKEAAIEAEVRAARERAIVPLEQRMKTFRQMLLENEVSAFSTWKKELHKIVFDKRYLLLTSDQRKQVFSKYVRERAEEERKEKMNRLQQKKDAFTALLKEAKLHAKSSFIDFSSKHGKDERFKGIDKPRNREQYFTEYLADLKKKEKEEKEKKREQVRTDFIALLKEKSIDRHARWADAKKKVDSDPRYKAVDSSSLKEDYFREYCKIVKEERKKEKEKEKDKDKDRDRSSSKKDKKDKEREKDRDKERDKDRDKERDKDRRERKSRKEKESDLDTSTEVEPPPEPERAPTDEEGDGAGAEGDDNSSEAREREARAQASIKEREREVQRALANSLRDRDKEREYHKRDEAVQHFNALLADLVRNPDLAWREAKKQLKKDHRYNLAELLGKEDKERLFTAHIGTLATRRRTSFRALLTSLGVSPTAAWRDVRRQLRSEPRAPQYQDSDKMEREFRDFQRDRQSNAKTSLRQLLQETRSITHRTHQQVQENPDALAAVHADLKHDARYTALEHLPEERSQIVVSYLEELHKKGPPPPPTATEPSRRAKQHA